MENLNGRFGSCHSFGVAVGLSACLPVGGAMACAKCVGQFEAESS